MKSPRRFTLILTLASLALLGVALWYFQPHTAPAAAPLAQTKPSAPEAKKTPDVPVITQSGAGQPAPTIIPAPAKTSPASPAASPQTVPFAAQQPQSGLAPASATPSPLTVTTPSAESSSAESAATARMYAAHASLRTPEVADPDSKANKKILQTMVLKALAQGATPAPRQQVTSAK